MTQNKKTVICHLSFLPHEKSPPKRGRGWWTSVLTQIVDDAADLPGSEDALATGVAQLAELVGERLAEVNPVL